MKSTIGLVALALMSASVEAQVQSPAASTVLAPNSIALARAIGGAISNDFSHYREFTLLGRICTAIQFRPSDGSSDLDTVVGACARGRESGKILISERSGLGGKPRFTVEPVFDAQVGLRITRGNPPIRFDGVALDVAHALTVASVDRGAVGALLELLTRGQVCAGSSRVVGRTTTASLTVCPPPNREGAMHFAEVALTREPGREPVRESVSVGPVTRIDRQPRSR